jgi:hypothetical protein
LTFFYCPENDEGFQIRSDVTEIENVKKISIKGHRALNKDLSWFLRLIHVEECSLSAGFVSDLSFCATVKKLTIIANGYDFPVDLSPLINLEELVCQCFRLVHFDHLSNLKKLAIYSVESLVNVSCFVNIPHLTFSNCPNLADVSCLGNATYLSFNRCPAISDVSSLGKVSTLMFDYCLGVTDVSVLGKGNHSVTISQAETMIGLSSLRSVYSVNLAGCRGDNIFGLTNVTKLDISFCSNITDISFLGESSVQELNMNMCSRITDITMLSSVKVLNVSNCEQIKHFHGLRSLTDLTMSGSDFEILSGFETFSQLEKLSIGQVVNHEELLPYIQHLKDLKLSYGNFRIHDFPSVQFLVAAAQGIDPSKLILLQCLREVQLHGYSGNDYHLIFPFLPFLRKLKLSSFRMMKKLEILGGSDDNNSRDEGEVPTSNKSFPIYHLELQCHVQLKEIYVSRRIAFMKTIECDKLTKVVGTGLVNVWSQNILKE